MKMGNSLDKYQVTTEYKLVETMMNAPTVAVEWGGDCSIQLYTTLQHNRSSTL